MFNFKELRVIHDALQNYPVAPERTEIIKKIFSMVSTRTFHSFAPCVRPRNPNRVEDTDEAERMVVFETERELMKLLEAVAFRKDSTIGHHQFIAVCVPNSGLADRLSEEIWRCLGRISKPSKYSLNGRHIELQNGLHIDVSNEGSYGMGGMTYEWVFFYNEVCGF